MAIRPTQRRSSNLVYSMTWLHACPSSWATAITQKQQKWNESGTNTKAASQDAFAIQNKTKTKTISRRASTFLDRGTLTTSIGTGIHKISDARTSTNTQHTYTHPHCFENTAATCNNFRHEPLRPRHQNVRTMALSLSTLGAVTKQTLLLPTVLLSKLRLHRLINTKLNRNHGNNGH